MSNVNSDVAATETLNFNPNWNYCGNRSRKLIRMTFGLWEYRHVIEFECCNNLMGADLLRWAAEAYSDRLWDSVPDDGFSNPSIVMKTPAGEKLHVEPDDDEDDDWLLKTLIAIEIIAITPEQKPTPQKET
jgi:hypothetical protein